VSRTRALSIYSTKTIRNEGDYSLLNKTRRYIIYALATVGFAILGNFTSLLAPSYFWGLTFGTLGLILSVVLELYIELAVKEEPAVQVILSEDKIVEVIREMRQDSSCIRIQALWCTRFGGEPEYYAEEEAIIKRNPRLLVQRLINPNRVERNAYEDHVKSRKALLDQGKYEVGKTDVEEFECLICEYEKPSGRKTKVFFTFIDVAGNRPGMGIFLDETKHEKVAYAVRAIESWYKREWLASAQHASLGNKET